MPNESQPDSNVRVVEDTASPGKGSREIRTGYTPALDLPGATVIPSHRNKFGAQAGQDPEAKLVMHVDPGYPDEFVIDASKLDSRQARDAVNAAQTGDDLLEDNKRIAGALEAAVQPVPAGAPAPQRFLVPPARPTKAAMAAPMPTVPAAPAAPAMPVTPEPTQVGAEAEVVTPEAASGSALTELGRVLHTLSAQGVDVAHMLEQQAATNTAEVPTAAVLAGAAQAAQVALTPAPVPSTAAPVTPVAPEAPAVPTVRVTFESALGAVTSSYHTVIQTQQLLVLAYNTRDTRGTRFTPAASLTTPYTLTVSATTEVASAVFSAYCLGYVFEFGDYEFSLFALAPPPVAAAPDTQV